MTTATALRAQGPSFLPLLTHRVPLRRHLLQLLDAGGVLRGLAGGGEAKCPGATGVERLMGACTALDKDDAFQFSHTAGPASRRAAVPVP